MKAGKLRPLASFGGKRAPLMPDVPTLKELGYDLEFYLWVGLFAPKGTPDNDHRVLARRREEGRREREPSTRRWTISARRSPIMDQPEFKAFWDADAAARRSRRAVDRQGGGVSGACPTLESLCVVLKLGKHRRVATPLPPRSVWGGVGGGGS